MKPIPVSVPLPAPTGLLPANHCHIRDTKAGVFWEHTRILTGMALWRSPHNSHFHPSFPPSLLPSGSGWHQNLTAPFSLTRPSPLINLCTFNPALMPASQSPLFLRKGLWTLGHHQSSPEAHGRGSVQWGAHCEKVLG